MRNKQIKTAVKLVVGIGVVGAAYAAGAGIIPMDFSLPVTSRASAATEIIQTAAVEAKLVEIQRVEYIEEVIIETEYVEVIKEVPATFRSFRTLQELEQWLNKQNDVIAVRFGNEDTIIDCEDYALEMQMKALEEGYVISLEIISILEYNELFSTKLPESVSLHGINLAVIGNSVFYIEPQTGEIVLAAYLD